MKTLWVVSGGIEAVAGIRRAGEMGLRVVVSDADPRAPGFELAHERVLASTYDAEATVAAALDYRRQGRPIDGVICIASDVPVTVARVAETLELPGIPVAAARLSADKLAMKRKFRSDGVAVPWFSPVEDPGHLSRLVAAQGPPLVLKPVDSRGARGVLRLMPGVDLGWAWDVARRESPTGRVMLERFLPGPQVSTESLVLDGVAHTPGFADRNYELLERTAPHIIENGGSLPSRLPEDRQREIRELVQRAAESLGIERGVLKGDLVVSGGRAWVIEVAARLSGGYLCTHEIPLNTGVDLVGAAIRVALGEPVDPAELEPRFQRGVAQRYLLGPPGRVVRIEGVEEVARRPEVAFCEIRVKIGDRIEPLRSHATRPGVVIATGSDAAQATERAVAAVGAIRIETDPAEEKLAAPAA